MYITIVLEFPLNETVYKPRLNLSFMSGNQIKTIYMLFTSQLVDRIVEQLLLSLVENTVTARAESCITCSEMPNKYVSQVTGEGS